jgi:divalent metal cation (Fe/Co/Zn/Cd) transporter
MDAHAPEVAEAATGVALGTPGVLGVERCEARRSGRGYRVVMHAEVDPQMTVADSHRLTGIVKQRVRDSMPEIDSVLIHIEPYEPAHAEERSAEPRRMISAPEGQQNLATGGAPAPDGGLSGSRRC